MLKLKDTPSNKEKYARLVEFLGEILDICTELEITPILDGSLAVFVYTGDRRIAVNDIDLSCSEADFPRIIQAFEERGIDYRLTDYHVLQALKGDLKVEFDSAEHWYGDLPMNDDYERLQLGDHQVKLLSLDRLKAFYRRGMNASEVDENEQVKYETLKRKYALLGKATGTD